MKNRKKNVKMQKLKQGLAALFLTAGILLMPVSGFAEEAAAKSASAEQTKYVMPQEQVYLDKSQIEAARKQKESDAFYNNQPQVKAPASVAEKAEPAEAKTAAPVAEKAEHAETKQTATVWPDHESHTFYRPERCQKE